MNVLRRFGVRFSGHERGGFEMAHLDIGQLVQRILADIQVGKLADGQRKLPAEPSLNGKVSSNPLYIAPSVKAA